MTNIMTNLTALGVFLVIVGVIGLFHKKLWKNFNAFVDWIDDCGMGLVVPAAVIWGYWSYASALTTPILGMLFLVILYRVSED